MTKVLVIRLDRLGDTLLTTPMLAALREHVPNRHLTVLASSVGAEVLRADPRVERVLVFDTDRTTLADKIRLAAQLRREHFDIVLNVSEKLWSRIFTRLSGAQRRVGFHPGMSQPVNALWLRVVLTDAVPSPNDPSVPSERHEVERYMQLLAALGLRAEAGPLGIRVDPAALKWGKEALDGLGIGVNGRTVGVHLSPKWGVEGWDPATLASAIVDLQRALPASAVVATYSSDERDWALQVLDRCRSGRIGAVETSRLEQWAGVLSGCKVVVTIDTGAAHLAAALGVAVVDIFPSRNYEHVSSRWRPWGVPARVLRRRALPANMEPAAKTEAEAVLHDTIITAVRELL